MDGYNEKKYLTDKFEEKSGIENLNTSYIIRVY